MNATVRHGRKRGFYVIAASTPGRQTDLPVTLEELALNVGIYLFDDVEVLDFAGPYEVFTTASRVHSRVRLAAEASTAVSPFFTVITIAREHGVVRARAGLRTLADFPITQHPRLDVLIVPGGAVDAELEKPDVIAWVRSQAGKVPLLASVCTGAFLLARTGRLDGLDVTTHWEDIESLRAMFPALTVREGVRWVDQGPIVTSAGISAGIDMSLHLVERLHSRELAFRTARQMDFDWKENP